MPLAPNARNISTRVDSRVNANTGANSGNGVHSGTSTTVKIRDRNADGVNTISPSSQDVSEHVTSQAVIEANRRAANAAAARQAAERRAAQEAAIRAEQQRNEQLHRQNDARIAREAREEQAKRETPDAMTAARQMANPAAATSTTASESNDELRPRLTPEQVAADLKALDEGVEPPTLRRAEVTNEIVSSDDGEPTNESRRRHIGEGFPRQQASRSRGRVPSILASSEAQPTVERDDVIEQSRSLPIMDVSGAVYDSETGEILREASRGDDVGDEGYQQMPPTREYVDTNRINDGISEELLPNGGFSKRDNNLAWRTWQDVTAADGDEDRQAEIIRNNENRRVRMEYGLMMQQGEDFGNTNFDAQDEKGVDNLDYNPGEGESLVRRKLRNAQNKIIRRFLNPTLLHIEGEHIETQTSEENGRSVTYGRIRYSDRAETAIGGVRRLYDCSIYNVMQLIQLRAGLGVDSKGSIANVDPDKFRLTEDQLVELCNDIIASQRANGNPLGPVEGTPGGSGVRDDTGRFVVVAKTRCFPLGYMPSQLIRDLRSSIDSPLHQMSEDQIQSAIKRQWLDETYPILLANTGGNLMWQARAIENMMRGLMLADGRNPADLKIPEIIERQTLMALRAEEASVNDPDIADANRVKRANMERELSRWRHRYQKQNGHRSSDGSIDSAATKRRRNRVGDAFRTAGMLQRAAKAANIGVMISSIPEALVAQGEQSVANLLSDALFNRMHADIATNFQFTDQLERLSQDKAAVEALKVAESLYRVGGHTALDAFFAELGDDGRAMNHLNKRELVSFLQRSGVYGQGASLSDAARQKFGVKPGEDAGFLSNLRRIIDGMDNMMLGSGMFSEMESKQFIRMSMAEMARSSLHGREAFTSEQVEGWGMGSSGPEEMVRSLLQTDAGREAFMTQGITSLGRKSPVEHQLRLIMAKNGLTEFAVRTMFDRFPEYGVNKVLQMIPLSNTLSFLSVHGIKSVGDILVTADSDTAAGRAFVRAGEAMQRSLGYQAGTRTSFAEGLRKNLLYDTVMASEKLLIAGLYCGIITALGGLQPPDDDEDRYTWSEWKIGSGDDAVPIKWAWWMDDLSGVGLPLGMAWAMCIQGDWSNEAKQTATNTFINAVANFNSGTALFDAIDLVNNFDEEWDAALGRNVGDYDPGYDEWAMTMLEQGFWNLIGDMTPTFIGQLVPWSKDYLFKGDSDAHTASRVYDVGEGSRYTMEEAREDYRTRRTDSYSDYMRRRSSQTNILQAMFYDWWMGAGGDDSAITGYKYTEQPLDTMVDPYVQAMYDRFYLDLDPASSDIPTEQAEREAELDARASAVVQWIDEHYQNATQANLDGFALNYEARVNCINYCYKQINRAWDQYREDTSHGYLESGEYQQVVQNRQDKIDHYRNLIYNFFQSDDIPWSQPRYVRQESDRETRYVDDQGNPMTFLDTLGESPRARAETYWYGNRPGILPFSSPRTAGKGWNYETIPYWAVRDKDGNPVGDVASAYDNAGSLVAGMGRNEGRNIRELMWGGQGSNMGPEADEELRIERGGVPTIGQRPWRAMEETFPESLRNLDAETVSKLLGIPSSLPTDGDESDESSDAGTTAYSGSGSYGGTSYGRSYYSGGGSSYNYNPKIYSSARQVYSQRASGIQTRQPYKATTTYLRPAFYTSGSREAYRRQQ